MLLLRKLFAMLLAVIQTFLINIGVVRPNMRNTQVTPISNEVCDFTVPDKTETDLYKSVEYASSLKNQVQGVYSDSKRDDYIMTNKQIVLTHKLTSVEKTATLTDRDGNAYLEDTFKSFYTDKLGVNQCVIQIRNSLLAECGSVPDDEQIEQFLITGTADMPEKYLKVMRDEAYKYVKSIFEKLSEYEYNPDLVKLYFIGGGGCLIKNFGEYDPERVEIISDICATAKGYESLAKAVMKNA